MKIVSLIVCFMMLLPPAEQSQLEDSEARSALPKFRTLPAAKVSEMTPSSATSHQGDSRNWPRSHGGDASIRYSTLRQIHRDNVHQLEVAWIYRSKDGTGNIQCNPIIVNGRMYAPTVGGAIVAIHGATGEEIWRRKVGGRPALRGLTYWKGEQQPTERLLFTSGQFLYALDAKTGESVQGFGEDGKVAAGGVVAPAVYKDIVVVAVWNVVK